MSEDFKERLRSMPDAKKLAVAIYGESVAAYRYGLLAEKSQSNHHRKLFAEMQTEEQGHQAALEKLAAQYFPNDDFVLTSEDKDLVIVGARLLDIRDERSFRRAMQFLHDTEKRTGEFYRSMHALMPDGEIGHFLTEMAEECFQHAESLLAIDPPSTS